MRVDEYVGKTGEKLTKEKWEALRQDKSYYHIAEYGNGKFHIKALWNGHLDFFAKTPQEAQRRWLPFDLIVLELKEGAVRHRTNDSESFASERSLINAYEDFLVRHNLGYWAPSMIVGEYHFVDVGNVLRATKDSPAMFGELCTDAAGSW